MRDTLTEKDIRSALDDCAAEPVHSPGKVQPFGGMVAVDVTSGAISYASENIAEFTGKGPEELLGRDAEAVFDRDIWHRVKNALAQGQVTPTNAKVGDFTMGDIPVTAHVYESAGHIVLELEFPREPGFSDGDALRTLAFLMRSIEGCQSERQLFDLTVRLMRMLSGYGRVMIYKFDRDWNGEVLAENLSPGYEPYLGLRFPHWDIPTQARAIMEKVPLRFICDVDQDPVRLLARDENAPPLDITLGYTRGVSLVHMEYLRNMGSTATMTLSLVVDGVLWGILSFHHQSPRIPPPALREVIETFGQVFSTKLQVLRQAARLAQVAKVDTLKENILLNLGDKNEFQGFATSMLDIMSADGMALVLGDRVELVGDVPSAPLLEHLKSQARDAETPLVYERLGEAFPHLSNAANGCAGALVLKGEQKKTLIIFRKERARKVNWAGNPDKTLEAKDGRMRLRPRGSFSTYLELVQGASDPWSEQDLYFASRIWTLVNLVERRELINAMTRQQQIMIDELNHRVRNILALVRSVSTQARRSSYGSINSYARSLEARIQALAASHDLASGGVVTTVPVSELIAAEFEPFVSERAQRYTLTGKGGALRADLAPIFSLVVHELVTNAVKYGALSNATGQVRIDLDETDTGLAILWRETGGPPAVQPNDYGFGTTLIQQAIPHELQGETSLTFAETGVEARLFLPSTVFKDAAVLPTDLSKPISIKRADRERIKAVLAQTTCLVVEDNFVIAEGLRGQLSDLGLSEIAITSNVEDALLAIAERPPGVALLDINLGGGRTSLPVAEELCARDVPFFFVSGYGEAADPRGNLKDVPVLAKPATTEELLGASALVLGLVGKDAE